MTRDALKERHVSGVIDNQVNPNVNQAHVTRKDDKKLFQFLKKLPKSVKVKKSLVYQHEVPRKFPQFADLEKGMLHPRLASFLERQGIKLYTHQRDAIVAVSERHNVIVSTSTASGKSLCYIIPIIDRLLKTNGNSTSLLVYPLKALAQDQKQKISRFLKGVGLPGELVDVYDADASQQEKRRIRNQCKIIITNPHGLHMYLGNLGLWKKFFSCNDFIMFDEVHVYNGVFGSNVAFLMRRLQRVANSFLRNPQWIMCSATIGNPKEHAEALSGLAFKLVENDGSGSARKFFWFWNPQVIQETGYRVSIHQDTRLLFRQLIQDGFQTLLFLQSRKMAELHARWAKTFFAGTEIENKITPYRAGYPAKTRRMLEKRIRQKEVIGISATNALELGIDVGTLDAVIISGFPGSMMSFWQQAGRCGRSIDEDALVIFCAGQDALDQYYINNTGQFFKKRHEDAVISLTNRYIINGQLRCAVKEIPVSEDDLYYFGPAASEAIRSLERDGVIYKRGNLYYYRMLDFPAQKIPLNSIPSNNYLVFELVDGGKKRLLTAETENRVFSTLHEGAVYLYMAETYVVVSLDLHSREVLIRKEDVDYYTEPLTMTTVVPVEIDGDEISKVRDASCMVPAITWKRGSAEPLYLYFGDVEVTTEYENFLRISISDGSVINQEPLNLPPSSFITKALYFNIPVDIHADLVQKKGNSLGGGIHAVEHVLISLFQKYVLCSRWDIGGTSIDSDPLFKRAMIYIYDGYPGGIGLTESAKEHLLEMMRDGLSIIENCSCTSDNGCPSCVQSPKCGNNNEPLSKDAAMHILGTLLATIEEPPLEK